MTSYLRSETTAHVMVEAPLGNAFWCVRTFCSAFAVVCRVSPAQPLPTQRNVKPWVFACRFVLFQANFPFQTKQAVFCVPCFAPVSSASLFDILFLQCMCTVPMSTRSPTADNISTPTLTLKLYDLSGHACAFAKLHTRDEID